MTRIIGGIAGGRRIKAPAGDSTRPTSDRVREALFSAIDAEVGSISGLRFLGQRRVAETVWPVLEKVLQGRG